MRVHNEPGRLSAVLLATMLVVSGCSRTPPVSTAEVRTVRVRLDWIPWAPHAAFYAAEEQGYYQEEKLRVKLYVPPDPEATTKLVAAGQDQFGISYMTDTILARSQGFKVVSIAALIDHPLNCIMTLRKSGLDKPEKLGGKVIGTTGVPSDEAFLEGILSRRGVKKGSYRLVNIGFNLAQALKSGKVDAIVGAYWPWEGINMEEDGYPVNKMELQDYGVPDYYELIIIAREDLTAKDPGLVRSFLRATVRGQAFVEEHPDKAVEILRKTSPDLKPEFLLASLHATLPLMQFPGGQFRQDEKIWSEMVRFMSASGLLKTPVASSAAFTNQFLPQ